MIVAYHFPHNDGIEYGILDKPGQDTGTALVDLYEADGVVQTFDSRTDAETWLRSYNGPRSHGTNGMGVVHVKDGFIGASEHYSYPERWLHDEG